MKLQPGNNPDVIEDVPCLQKLAEISTIHVSRETSDYLDEQALIAAKHRQNRDPMAELFVAGFEYGWFLRVPCDIEEENPNGCYPSDVLKILRWANKLGAEFVLIDADADQVDELEKYEW